jgi:hypothetical protein
MMENGQRIKPNKDLFFPRDDAEFYKARCDELEARLARVEALLIDDCNGYPKGCEKCSADYDGRVLHRDACMVYQCMEALK